MNPELSQVVERIVHDRITEIVGAVRRSSVEISRTSTGKPGFSVKVYDPDPYAAVNKAREIEQRLAVEFGFIDSAEQGKLFDKGESAPAPAPAPAPDETPPADALEGWE